MNCWPDPQSQSVAASGSSLGLVSMTPHSRYFVYFLACFFQFLCAGFCWISKFWMGCVSAWSFTLFILSRLSSNIGRSLNIDLFNLYVDPWHYLDLLDWYVQLWTNIASGFSSRHIPKCTPEFSAQPYFLPASPAILHDNASQLVVLDRYLGFFQFLIFLHVLCPTHRQAQNCPNQTYLLFELCDSHFMCGISDPV